MQRCVNGLQVFPRKIWGVPWFAHFSAAKQDVGVMKLKTNTLSGRQGFSLVELLVVIAVIGIIAAIAIPNIANITGNATYAKSQRNAQSIASVANAAIAAGYAPTTWTHASAVVTALASGTSITVPAPNGNAANAMTFSVSQLDPTEQTNTYKFLTATGTGAQTTVSYVASGSAPADGQ